MNLTHFNPVRAKIAVCTTIAFLFGALAFAQPPQKDKKDAGSKESGTVNLHIIVTGGDKDAPVANASVYVRFPRESGFIRRKQKMAEMNLKTNQEGTVNAPPVPRGKVLIQVIAEGWKTFGQWYTLANDDETIKIKLEKPPKWY